MNTSHRPSRQGLNRILACISLTRRGAIVAVEAARIAAALDAVPVYLHVGEEGDHTRTALRELLKSGGIDPAKEETIVREGKVQEVVYRTADEIGATLIVNGALEKEGVIGYYIGSTARRIARHARQSVLLVTEPSPEEHPFRSIAVSIDFDEVSRETLRYAASFAQRVGARSFHVIHEYEAPALRLGLDDAFDMREEREKDAILEIQTSTHLLNFIEGVDFSGLDLETVCLRGRRGFESAMYARTRRLDLLVTPAPQRKLGLFDKLFQHDVEYALEALPCALLLHRNP
ncbi:MAG: universal stress protein [Bacteroidota bacterium]|nr:universal stress protein [Bacteroidota bacterium]